MPRYDESFEQEEYVGAAGGAGAYGYKLTRESLREAVGISRTSSTAVDESELVEAAQEEYSAKKKVPRQRSVIWSRKEIERLGERIYQLGQQGPNKTFHNRIAEKLKQYGIVPPSIQVEYRGLTVETEALVGGAGIPTVGNIPTQIVKRLLGSKAETTNLTILNKLNGILKPGRLTLLLGPPSSGKSTYLKMLAGRLKIDRHLKISGEVKYNGHTEDEFVLRATAAYVDQHDKHDPSLTVQETLEFAYLCQNGLHAEGIDFNLPEELIKAKQKFKAGQAKPAARNGAGKEEVLDPHMVNAQMVDGKGEDSPGDSPRPLAPTAGDGDDDEAFEALLQESWGTGVKTEMVERMLGIHHVRQTQVGDPQGMIRGVSGGERKRVTTAEMLVGPRRVMLMDEISTGLDSATLFSIISFFAQVTHGMQLTTVISLLQPPPEVYALFDDLILMADGHIVYHGAIERAMPFFAGLGFRCPERKDVPSFLQEVTTASGQQQFATDELRQLKVIPEDQAVNAGGRKKLLMTVEDMAAAFWNNDEQGKAMMDELQHRPFDRAAGPPRALKKFAYALSAWDAVKLVTRRQIMLTLRDKILLRARLIQVAIIGAICGSLFYDKEPFIQNGPVFFGASFMSVMFMAMGSMPQMMIVLGTKSVFFKQRDNLFFPAYAQAVAWSLSQLPLSALEATVFSSIAYFMIHFYWGPGYFFIFLLIMISASVALSALFRFIACVAPNGVRANAIAGLVLVVLIVTSGFVIVRGAIPDWWIWAYWISPFSYALRAIVINEMTSPAWSYENPRRPGITAGRSALESFSFQTERWWIWVGVGYLWGFFLLFTFLSAIVLTFTSGDKKTAQVADEEEVEKAHLAAEARRQHLRESVSHTDLTKAKDGAAPNGGSSSSLPFTPIAIAWRDLRYFVPNPAYAAASKAAKQRPPPAPKGDIEQPPPPPAVPQVPERLELLKGITGYCEPGCLMALMGGSGAGKTTLMDVIAGRKTIGQIQGDIMVNGHPKEQKTWARVVGYVEQFDIHSPAQTVMEALQFSARLRLPPSITNQQVQVYIEEVMEMVDLMDLQSALVGSPGLSGLSTEQRKRLTIAVELVANPSVIFMDEPTSGLDARAAAIVMRSVRNVARNGRTVMVTIHQPSIEIFEAFDTLLLLQRGGRVTYFGPLGLHSSALVAYLQAVPGTQPIMQGYNPATWMLEVTGGSTATLVKPTDADFPALYAQSELCASARKRVQELEETGRATTKPLHQSSLYASPFRVQAAQLLHKFWMIYWRTPSYNFTRLTITTLTAVFYGSMYYKKGSLPDFAKSSDVQNIIGVLFSSTNFLGSINFNTIMPLAGFERIVFYRERGAAMYDPYAYSMAFGLVEIPYLLAQGCIFVPILYWMVGFARDAGKFFYYFLLFLESIAFYTTFGQFLVYVTPSQPVAQVLGASANMMFAIFNGFTITYPNIPIGWKWMNRIVPTTWVLYGLGGSQVGNQQEQVTQANGVTTTAARFVETYFGYHYNMIYWMLLILAAYVIFFRLLSVFALKYMNFYRR